MTLIGWCPGGRPVEDMLARFYPGTRTVRIFVGARDPLPAWDEPILGQLGDVLPHVSFKRWDLAALAAWLDGMPDRPLILTYAHEPEQGTAAGDPPLEVWRTRWAELVAELADHPKRELIRLVPVYTRFWWQAHPNDLRWLFAVPGVDAIGWDIYNNGTSYRTPDDLLSIPRDIAKRTGLPYLIAELGAVRIAGDADGSGRTAWMRAMVAAARADGAWTACWFHKDEWDLAGWPAEQQTWRDIIAEEASMAWSKGQPWRIVRSLERLNEQIRAAYPQAVPPATPAASWGSIADSAHSSTSDHYPHYYSALGKTAVVCARDFPHAPALGLDAHALADRLRASRDSRIAYVISNGRITGPSHNWRWDPYTGSDPHDTHIHVSTVHTAAADDPRDWQIGDEDMPLTQSDIGAVKAAILSDGGMQQLFSRVYQLGVNLTALTTAVGKLPALVGAEGTNPTELSAALAGLPKPVPVDVDGLASALAPKLVASLPADSPITDGQLERVLRSVLGSLDADAPQAG